MPCRTYFSRLVLLAATPACSAAAFAQQPASLPPPSPNRAPTITLIVPAEGVPIPADKPVVLFRFSANDSSDAIDPSSLRMSVDGLDRTSLLQLGAGEAWGPLAPDSSASSLAIASGVHLVHARVCSVRGVCGQLDAPVTVIPAGPVAQSGAAADSSVDRGSPVSLIRMLLELVLALARKLIGP